MLEAFHYTSKIKTLPYKLYRYMKCDDYMYDVIENSRCHLSSVDEFDDTDELGLHLIQAHLELGTLQDGFSDVSAKLNGNICVTMDVNGRAFDFDDQNKYLHEWDTRQIHDRRQKYKVLCFTVRPDNEYMWHNYADCHRGVCLEFSGMINACANQNGFQGYVYYEDVKNLSKDLLGKDACDPEILLYPFFHKTNEYAKEEEVRLVIRTVRKYLPFSPTVLSSIYYGKQITLENKIRLENCIQKNNPNIHLMSEIKANP